MRRRRRRMKQLASSSRNNNNNLSSSSSVFGGFSYYNIMIVKVMSTTFCILTMMNRLEGKGIMFVVRASSSSSSSAATTRAATYYSRSSYYKSAAFLMINQQQQQQQQRRSSFATGGSISGLVLNNNEKPFHHHHHYHRHHTTTTTSRGGGLGGSSRTLSPPKTTLYMNFLQNFFGGGAYNLRIDYTTLDYPGNELGQLAIDLSSNTKGGAKTMPLLNPPSNPSLELMTIAGGCFWGMELAFQRIVGVNYTVVGYIQGQDSKFPTYDQVCAGNTGHTEAVCIYFDPLIINYSQLLDVFFDRVNPTTINGQGKDYGRQYRTGIYYHSLEQESIARERFQQESTKYSKPIATELKQSTIFWPAEKYHQQYLNKGGRFGNIQSSEKGCTDEIRCYG